MGGSSAAVKIFVEVTASHVPQEEGLPGFSGEDEAVILPRGTRRKPLLRLLPPVCLQRLDGGGGKCNGSTAVRGHSCHIPRVKFVDHRSTSSRDSPKQPAHASPQPWQGAPAGRRYRLDRHQ
jgi:hypothetical protein